MPDTELAYGSEAKSGTERAHGGESRRGESAPTCSAKGRIPSMLLCFSYPIILRSPFLLRHPCAPTVLIYSVFVPVGGPSTEAASYFRCWLSGCKHPLAAYALSGAC
eukprot:3769602-Rhodomonas_salina.2